MARDPRPDRPSLDPEFVATQTFSSSFRGFDVAEVRGFLEVIADLLREGDAREEALASELAEAKEKLAHPPPLDEQQLTMLLGEETTRVIGTARQAALDIRSKSEENAARLVREAIEQAAEVRSAAEEQVAQILAELERETTEQRAAADEYAAQTRGGADEEMAGQRAEAEADAKRMRDEAEAILGVRTEEAETVAASIRGEVAHLRDEAAAEVQAMRAEAEAETTALRAQAATDAETQLEQARQQGRSMVAEARAVRERMLTDLVERRRIGRAHLDQLRGTRQWMLEVLESARSRIDQAAGDLAAPLASDRAVIEDRAPQDAEDDALLESMMAEQPESPTPEAGASRPTESQPSERQRPEATPSDAGAPMAAEPAPGPAVVPPEVKGTATDPAAASAAPAPAPGAERANIDALFAKIRAARVDDMEKADEVLVDLTGEEAATGDPAAASPTAAAEAVSEEVIVVVGEGPVDLTMDVGAPDQLASLLERRDAATDEIERRLARRLKRILSDEQNELLDQVRRTAGMPTADAVLPELGAHAARYAGAATDDLVGAAAAGAQFYGEPTPEVVTEVDDVATHLAEELVRQLRGRLTRCFSDTEADEAELGDRIRACYREWKTQRIAETSRHFVLAAFTRGLFDAAPRASAFRWIVDDGGTPCPDAEDNALQGEVAKGEPFPTGDIYPPAHPGCRCLIVPVEAAVISRS